MTHILLLEDDPVDYELISTTLSRSGIGVDVVRVTEQEEFLESLETLPPDLILADYALPAFDGLSALRLAQARCPQVPFILISGVLGEEQAIEALKQGATDYVLKQRLERLSLVVGRALRESRDRQERRQVANALKRTDDLLQAIVDASPVGIVTLDRQQRVMTWNPTAEKLYGWTAEATLHQPLALIPLGQQASFNTYFTEALNNTTVVDKEFLHLRQDGSQIDINLSLAPLHNADNHVYGVVMTTVDITPYKIGRAHV